MYELTRADRVKGAERANVVRAAKSYADVLRASDAWQLMDALGREGLQALSVATTLRLAAQIASNEVPVPTTATAVKELAQALKVAHQIMRLEHGESTANTATNVTRHDVAEVLRQRAAALDAADAPIDIQHANTDGNSVDDKLLDTSSTDSAHS